MTPIDKEKERIISDILILLSRKQNEIMWLMLQDAEKSLRKAPMSKLELIEQELESNKGFVVEGDEE
jgi:hypothetical protein